MNTIVVVDTAGNVKRIADTLAKVDAKKPEAPTPAMPKKMSLQMTDQPWEKVLEWYAEASGVRGVHMANPTGTFSHTPPSADTRYTIGEVTDILNDALAKQKLILIRRLVAFSVVPNDGQAPHMWDIIPRIEPSELADRGRTEMVQVVIPFRHPAAESVMPEVRKLLTPAGAATVYGQSVVVVDAAGSARRVAQFLADAEAKK